MKIIKKLMILLSILMLLESCMATRPQGPQNKERTTEQHQKQYSKREKRDRLLLFLVIIPTVIWIFTPKPLKQ